MAMPAPSPLGSRQLGRAPGFNDQMARMEKFRQELHEAKMVLGGESGSRRNSLGAASTISGDSMNQIAERKEFKEWSSIHLRSAKYCYSDADTWLAMIKGYAAPGDKWKQPDPQSAVRLEETKKRNQALKDERTREEENHKRLQQLLSEGYREAHQAFTKCSHEYEMLQQDQAENAAQFEQAGEGEDLDLCPAWANGPHAELAAEAERQQKALLDTTFDHNRERERSSQLQDEKARLLQELEALKAQSLEANQKHEQARKACEDLQTLNDAQRELGLPEIVFNDNGTHSRVVLNGDAAGTIEEAVRTVNIEYDKDGALMSASPHASLGLEHEADEAVRHDDLAALLTMVWQRICDPSEGRRVRPRFGGC